MSVNSEFRLQKIHALRFGIWAKKTREFDSKVEILAFSLFIPTTSRDSVDAFINFDSGWCLIVLDAASHKYAFFNALDWLTFYSLYDKILLRDIYRRLPHIN